MGAGCERRPVLRATAAHGTSPGKRVWSPDRVLRALWLCLAALALAAARPAAGATDPASPDRAARARVLVQVSLAAGLAHHEAKQVWDRLRVGDPLTLVREAGNAHDSNAVRIDWHGRVLGYLPRAENADIARQMDRGQALQARISGIAKYRNHRKKLQLEIFVEL
jgi:hypothetical protein